MTSVAVVDHPVAAAAPVKLRHYKLAVSLAIVTGLLALLFLAAPSNCVSRFRLGDPRSSLDLPTVAVPTAVTAWSVWVVLLGLTVYALWAAYTYRRPGPWLPIVYGVLGIFAFLVWAASGGVRPPARTTPPTSPRSSSPSSSVSSAPATASAAPSCAVAG